MLNLSDIDISSRRVTRPPTGPRCTARLFDCSPAGPAVLIPYQANGASHYLGAPAAPQHTGTYRLHHAIHIEGLRGFIKKYGH